MRFSNAQYLEKEVVTVSCRNNRSSGAILDGQPVFLQDVGNATNFGTDSILAGDANYAPALVAGIAKWYKLAGTSSQLTGAQVGDVFEAVAYGFTDAIITLRTRTSSTLSWNSSPAINVGDQLIAETVGQNLAGNGAMALSSPDQPFIAAQSQASQSSGASNMTLLSAASNALVDTIRMKVFVRAM